MPPELARRNGRICRTLAEPGLGGVREGLLEEDALLDVLRRLGEGLPSSMTVAVIGINYVALGTVSRLG